MLSVALCTYNGEKFIEEQLLSIINQSMTVDEIIVCDDNSSDNTTDIVHKISNNSSIIPIRLIRNDNNLGYIRNFYKAISLCKGDIIFLSDQDDIWMPRKVEEITR